jgi:hypothetical protein
LTYSLLFCLLCLPMYSSISSVLISSIISSQQRYIFTLINQPITTNN